MGLLHPFQKSTSPARRLNMRVQTPQHVWVFWTCDGRDEVARVHDLSAGGVFVETVRPKGVGMATKLHFLVPEGQIRADAIVRHATDGRGMGLKFTAVHEQDRSKLVSLVKRLRSGSKLWRERINGEDLSRPD
jgi:c-di-GMP-binding flagellar brake protein YcgR